MKEIRMTIKAIFKSHILALSMVALITPASLFAGETVDRAGEAIGLTAGNAMFVPVKMAVMGLAAPLTAISWIASLGDTEQAKAIWKDSTDQPYFISPKEARKAIGQRPDLKADWNPARDPVD